MTNEWCAVHYKSDPPQSPFAPQWDFTIGEKQIDIDCEELTKIILQKEEEIKSQFPASSDGNTGLGPDSLTSRFRHFNVLTWRFPATDQLHQEIKKFHRQYYQSMFGVFKAPPKVRIRCLANVLRKGERIKKHWHSVHQHTYLGGHLTVAAVGTKTIYEHPYDNIGRNYEAENVPGKLTLFPNYLPHYTTVNQQDSPRITIAFDLTQLDTIFTDDDDHTLIQL